MPFQLTEENKIRQRDIVRHFRIMWRVEEAKAGRLVPTDGITRKCFRARYGHEAPRPVSRYSKQWAEVATKDREGYLQHLRRTS